MRTVFPARVTRVVWFFRHSDRLLFVFDHTPPTYTFNCSPHVRAAVITVGLFVDYISEYMDFVRWRYDDVNKPQSELVVERARKAISIEEASGTQA